MRHYRFKDPLALLYSLPKTDFLVECFYAADQCAVVITHRLSGAVGECGEERRQPLNKRRAFERLIGTPEYKFWKLQQAIEQIAKENNGTDRR